MGSRTGVFAGAAAAGFVAGWFTAQHRFERHRADLFSARPLRRLAALGFLAGQNGVETIRLLRDYVAWEHHPVLRRRAHAIVRRMEAAIR
ncbi:MAG TPA: hypothetical protein VFW66_14570 [Gemmatimonadales bacterium]|nr:hypothetical protein [Gemmatimonadales bacterium]